jgi:hypothetical protein
MAETTTTESISRLAPYREEYEKALLQGLMGTAGPSGITGGLVATPVTIPEQKVAPITQETLDAYALAKAGLGAYQPYMQAAQQSIGQAAPAYQTGAATTAAAIPMYQAGAAQYQPTAQGIAQFMSPYQSLVTQEALRQMDREAAVAQQQASAQAVKSGAFGGSREGVMRAELARNLQDIKSQRIAQDLQQNYQQALTGSMDAFQAARARELMAAQGLGQTGVSQAGIGQLYSDLAQQQVALGGAGQAFLGQDVGVLESMGSNLQKQQQLALDAARQTALQQAYEPYQRLGFTSDIMRGLPTVQSTIGTTTAPSPSPMSQALGAGISGLGIYGVLSNQPWATGRNTGASSLFTAGSNLLGG